MRERLFRFKQFSVRHSVSAMKVGTDGVTLGAWASVCSGDSVLDVGCGCGLIGLMMAQRGAGSVTMLDIDSASVGEAKENAAMSAWADRVQCQCVDFGMFVPEGEFDRIVSNPPFFNNGALAPESCRAMARHELSLTLDVLVSRASCMLSPRGSLSLILPADREDDARFAAEVASLGCRRSCRLYTRRGAEARRVLLEFARGVGEESVAALSVESDEYKLLTSAFYL